jgi:hypothetical protein
MRMQDGVVVVIGYELDGAGFYSPDTERTVLFFKMPRLAVAYILPYIHRIQWVPNGLLLVIK